jgi:hypothetical protein
MRRLLIGQIFISVMGILVDKIGTTPFWYARLSPPLSWVKMTHLYYGFSMSFITSG